MRYGELNAAQRDKYLAALTQSHRIRPTVTILDGDEDPIEDLVITEGQVDCDAKADVTRLLSVTVPDPHNQYLYDPLGPVYADKFLDVSYDVYVDELSEWVEVPVFRGPVSRYSRAGHEVHIEAQGKESLIQPPRRQTAPGNLDTRNVAALIEQIARSYGERTFNVGEANGKKVPTKFNADLVHQLNRKTEHWNRAHEGKKHDRKMIHGPAIEHGAWKFMQQLADKVNMELFYDGRGVLTLRPVSINYEAWVFESGNGGSVLSDPHVDYDLTNFHNSISITGHRRDGGKQKPKNQPTTETDLATVYSLPADHPLSPQSLAWNGVPREFRINKKVGQHILSKKAAAKMAEEELTKAIRSATTVEFDALVVPHLEVNDNCRLKTDTIDTPFKITEFSIPLQASSNMSIGYLKRAPVRKFATPRLRTRHVTTKQIKKDSH